MSRPQRLHKAKRPKRPAATTPYQSQQATQSASGGYQPPEPRNEQEKLLREAALRRERALLWTDDRSFSIWK